MEANVWGAGPITRNKPFPGARRCGRPWQLRIIPIQAEVVVLAGRVVENFVNDCALSAHPSEELEDFRGFLDPQLVVAPGVG